MTDSYCGILDSCFFSFVFSKLLGTYLASISLYMATKIMIEKYENGSFIIYTLVALGFINAIEVLGQYFGSPFAMALPQILQIPMSEEDLELFVNSEPPLQYVGGLMGIVNSGYFLSATSVMALYNSKNKILKSNWIVFAVIFLALVLVQERSGLYVGLFCVFIYLVLFSLRNKKTLWTTAIISIVFSIVISRYLIQYISIEDLRYISAGVEDTRRIDNAINALNWLIRYPAGGANSFYDMGGYYPHNIFINALLYGGIIGGGILIGILFSQMYKIWGIMYSYYQKEKYSSLLLVCGIAYLCYTFNSFFHNYSLVFGGETIFLLWAMIGSLKGIEDDASEDIDMEIEDMESGTMMEE